jgi:hypoxanthine phosphoribosyltransferase
MGEVRIYAEDTRSFSPADKDFLSNVANIVALVLERSELLQLLTIDPRETKTKRHKLIETPGLPYSSLRPSNFSHPSEEEFAKLLDFYRIEWLYEPRSFPVSWQDNKITEMFTPDFYLPELDLYIELTTLKQRLITEKNRKLRQLKEFYPEINVKLLNKSDYFKLLAKYGYGPLGVTKIKGINQVLFSQNQIQRQVRVLAKRISHDYAGKQLVLVGVLKGVVCFMSDLMRNISIPLTTEFMAISYYSGDAAEPAVKITKDIDATIAGLNVLMIEDVVDTGMTLNYILNHLSAHNPASLRVCTLLDKRVRRLVDVSIDYIGFQIPDEFVVGYGLDYHGEYRNLPFVGVLNPEVREEVP